MKGKKKEDIKSLRENPMSTKEAFHRVRRIVRELRKKREENLKKGKDN